MLREIWFAYFLCFYIYIVSIFYAFCTFDVYEQFILADKYTCFVNFPFSSLKHHNKVLFNHFFISAVK